MIGSTPVGVPLARDDEKAKVQRTLANERMDWQANLSSMAGSPQKPRWGRPYQETRATRLVLQMARSRSEDVREREPADALRRVHAAHDGELGRADAGHSMNRRAQRLVRERHGGRLRIRLAGPGRRRGHDVSDEEDLERVDRVFP